MRVLDRQAAEWMDDMIDHVSLDIGAADCLTRMLHNNHKLLHGKPADVACGETLKIIFYRVLRQSRPAQACGGICGVLHCCPVRLSMSTAKACCWIDVNNRP